MNKVAIVVLADTETHENLGRIVNAMEAVKEFKEAGDDVQLIFDGAGVKWVGELSNADHKYHELFNDIKDKVKGACSYCSGAFGVADAVTAYGIDLANEFEGHPSFHKMVTEGYTVITF